MESAGGTMTVDVTYADEIGCAGALELEGQEVGGARIVVMRVAGGKNGLFGQMRGGRVALEESADEEHFDSGSRVLYEDEDDKAPMVRGQSMWSRVLNVIYGW
ncbi:hypothetical protein HK101_006078 [Irineochytrium annulatum]|nr:hypothetical protein HK101_006078 [Irineochytrium annulatum]